MVADDRDEVEIEEDAVLGRIWDDAGRVEDAEEGGREGDLRTPGVVGRAETCFRRVLGVAGRERESMREGEGGCSEEGESGDAGVLGAGSLGWLKLVEMVRREVGVFVRVEDFSFAEAARFLGGAFAGIGGFFGCAARFVSIASSLRGSCAARERRFGS